MRALISGDGNMGRAISSALEARGDTVVAMVGRSSSATTSDALANVDVSFEFSHATSLLEHIGLGLAADCRAFVIGTTGWSMEDAMGRELQSLLANAAARAVVAPTFSLGAILFSELAEQAARLFGSFPDYDPYVFEEHRRAKADRPSGTALAVADRLLPYLPAKREARLATGPDAPDPDTLEVVALRAGTHPGMHVVGFEGPGESLELRVAARDRSAYVAGALLAADDLMARPDVVGITDFVSLINRQTEQSDTKGTIS